MAITAGLFGDRGRKRAEKLGIDPNRLPPGQSPTEKFPVLTVGPTVQLPREQWSLSVYGAVDEPYAVRFDELTAMEQTTVETDIHCVTRWSKFDTTGVGVKASDLLERARVHADATHVLVHAHGGYSTNLPLNDLLLANVIVTHTFDGAPLEADHGGPVRLLVPHLYLWKSAKWVQSLEVRTSDELGFWERNGYHHRGDPWAEERRSVPEYVARQMRRDARERGIDG